MNDTNPNNAAGPAERLMHLGERLLSMMVEASRTRIELMTVEFAVERVRLIRLLFVGLIFGIAAGLGLAFASFWVVAFFWETHRLAAIGGVTIFYVLIAAAMALLVQRMVSGDTPFSHTLDTLQRDYAAIQGHLRRARHPDVTDVIDPLASRDQP